MVLPAMKLALQEELDELDRDMGTMTGKRNAIVKLLKFYASPNERAAKSVAVAAELPTSGKSRQMSSLHMARVVIRNAGCPRKAEEILDGIKRTFGVTAPKTASNMLSRAAKTEGSGFFREEDGRIGLSEMTPQVEMISDSTSAA